MLRYRAKSDSTFVVSVEKWASNKERTSRFVLNLVKHLPKISRIHEWFKRFQEGREALEDDERSGRPINVVKEENAEIVREFIRKEPKSSLKYMESELGISAASIYRILTENLVYIKVCAKFVPHTLKPHEKDLRIFDYLTKSRIVTINHSPYSPDMAPCDFYLSGELYLAMKGKRYYRHTQRHTEGWPKKVIR